MFISRDLPDGLRPWLQFLSLSPTAQQTFVAVAYRKPDSIKVLANWDREFATGIEHLANLTHCQPSGSRQLLGQC